MTATIPTACGACEIWCSESCMDTWHTRRMLADPPLPILPRRLPADPVPAEAIKAMHEQVPVTLVRTLEPEPDETYLPEGVWLAMDSDALPVTSGASITIRMDNSAATYEPAAEPEKRRPRWLSLLLWPLLWGSR